MRIKAFAALLTLSWATASLAQTAAPATPPVFKFEMHGFVSGTLFAQDGTLAGGNGQIGYFPTAPFTAVNGVAVDIRPKQDAIMLGGDARQSRFNWSVVGPAVMGGATPRAVLEIDWMGNFGGGNQGEVHLLPRLRLAYSELNWGADRVIIGQNYDLTAALGPVTLAHIGAPYLLSSGNMGFRRPGVFYYHTFGDLKDPKSLKTEFAVEAGRAQWTDVYAAAGGNACAGNIFNGAAGANPGIPGNNVCAGEASGLPAVQARLAFSKGAAFSAFLAGHWNKIDRSGYGVVTPDGARPPNSDLDVIGGNAGFKSVFGPLTLAAAGYYGKNLSPLYGGFGTVFFPSGGDVHEYGVWGQVGFNLTKELSAWYFMGVERINDKDLPGSSFAANREVNWNAMIQYRDGGYALGLEWLQMRADYIAQAPTAAVPAGVPGGRSIVNQVAFTGNYYF